MLLYAIFRVLSADAHFERDFSDQKKKQVDRSIEICNKKYYMIEKKKVHKKCYYGSLDIC
jgi:hypothetical protein